VEFRKARAEVAGVHQPATTMVEVSCLVDEAVLIEIETDAAV